MCLPPRIIIVASADTLNPMRLLPVLCLLVLAACFGCSREEPAATPVAAEQPAPAPEEVLYELNFGENIEASRLLRGLYDSEGPWRWTARTFSVSLDRPRADSPLYVELDFALAKPLMDQFQSVTLSASANGHDVGSETFTQDGRYLFSKPLPPEALTSERIRIDFELDKAQNQGGQGGRELGLIAVSLALKGREESTGFLNDQLSRAQRGYREIIRKRDLRLSLEKQNELMKLFHELDVWDNMWFQGIKIIKNPCDLWMMQQIMHEIKPDFVVETGTMRGGSALYWAHTLSGLGLENSKVLTVDVTDEAQEAAERTLWKKHVQFFHGSSTDPAIVEQISQIVKGKTVLVVLDSDHTMKHVREELRLFSPLVSAGSYIVVEDTHYDSVPTHPERGPGPMAAVNAFLRDGGSALFEQDVTREAMVMTFNPGGWLRRKIK